LLLGPPQLKLLFMQSQPPLSTRRPLMAQVPPFRMLPRRLKSLACCAFLNGGWDCIKSSFNCGGPSRRRSLQLLPLRDSITSLSHGSRRRKPRLRSSRLAPSIPSKWSRPRLELLFPLLHRTTLRRSLPLPNKSLRTRKRLRDSINASKRKNSLSTFTGNGLTLSPLGSERW